MRNPAILNSHSQICEGESIMQCVLTFTDAVEHKLLNFFFRPDKKGSITLEKHTNGNINVQTSQIKFSFTNFFLVLIAVITFTSGATHFIDRVIFKNDAQERKIEELQDVINEKVDSIAIKRGLILDQIQKDLNELKRGQTNIKKEIQDK